MANSFYVDDDDYKPWLIGAIVFLIIFVAFFGVGIYLLTNQCLVVPIGGFAGTAFLFRKAHGIKKDNI